MWSLSRTISVRKVNRCLRLVVNASVVLTLGLISQVAEELWEVKDKKIRNLTKVRRTPPEPRAGRYQPLTFLRFHSTGRDHDQRLQASSGKGVPSCNRESQVVLEE